MSLNLQLLPIYLNIFPSGSTDPGEKINADPWGSGSTALVSALYWTSMLLQAHNVLFLQSGPLVMQYTAGSCNNNIAM